MNVIMMGKGYPLVLMHGGPGLDYQTLLPLQPLADHYTLVFYDHRCNGESVGAEISSMTMDNLTADAEALRQSLGFEKWAVLGHSFGGNVALEYALRYPQNLSRLILMNTGGDQWWVNQNAPDLLSKRGYSPSTVQAARRFFNGQFKPTEFLRIFIKFEQAYNYRNSPLDIIRGIFSGHMPKTRPEATIFGYSHVLKDWTVIDRLGEIKAPTLILAGRYDFLFPTEHQELRQAQSPQIPSGKAIPDWFRRTMLLPMPLPQLFIAFLSMLIRRNPAMLVAMQGTVGVTAVGMFGKGHSGWGISATRHSFDLVVGSTAWKPAVVEGRIEPRELLHLTVVFDHEVVDGAPAARFTRRLVELIESGFGLSES